tara:strand:- start:3343 stop:3669 length:327 start_codon:yes stop_codon:yes gene_type:complete
MEALAIAFLIFVALCWGFYKRNRPQIDADCAQLHETVTPHVDSAVDKAVNIALAPFIKMPEVVRGRPNPDMDELKAKQEAELSALDDQPPSDYEDEWENSYWAQLDWD